MDTTRVYQLSIAMITLCNKQLPNLKGVPRAQASAGLTPTSGGQRAVGRGDSGHLAQHHVSPSPPSWPVNVPMAMTEGKREREPITRVTWELCVHRLLTPPRAKEASWRIWRKGRMPKSPGKGRGGSLGSTSTVYCRLPSGHPRCPSSHTLTREASCLAVVEGWARAGGGNRGPLKKASLSLRFSWTKENYISQPPLQRDGAMPLSSGRQDVSGSDVCHFQAWSPKSPARATPP